MALRDFFASPIVKSTSEASFRAGKRAWSRKTCRTAGAESGSRRRLSVSLPSSNSTSCWPWAAARCGTRYVTRAPCFERGRDAGTGTGAVANDTDAHAVGRLLGKAVAGVVHVVGEAAKPIAWCAWTRKMPRAPKNARCRSPMWRWMD